VHLLEFSGRHPWGELLLGAGSSLRDGEDELGEGSRCSAIGEEGRRCPLLAVEQGVGSSRQEENREGARLLAMDSREREEEMGAMGAASARRGRGASCCRDTERQEQRAGQGREASVLGGARRHGGLELGSLPTAV
jgi:hypothetical protein